MSERWVFAVDIGSTKIACIAATSTQGGLISIHAVAKRPSTGMCKGVVSDVAVVARELDEAVSEVETALEISARSLVVSIGGSHLQGLSAQGLVPLFPRGRVIMREDILQVINHSRQLLIPPDREQVQAVTREFKVDGRSGIQHPVGMPGSKLEVVTHVITGSVSHVTAVERAVGMNGRSVEQMVVMPVASALAVLTPEGARKGTAVVDIGGGTTDIAIFTGGSVAHTSSLPVGGQHVTQDLAELLKVSFEEAERLKLMYGCAIADAQDGETVEVTQVGRSEPRRLSRKVLCEIVESRMREIAKLASKQIERSRPIEELEGGLILTGGGSQLPGTDRLFSNLIPHSRPRVQGPMAKGKHADALARPEMSTAVGLVIHATRDDEEEISPASGLGSWKERIRTLKTKLSGRG